MSSCAKQIDFTPADKNYVFTIEDIKGMDFSGYMIKPYHSGKGYYFSKEANELHGLYGLYSVNLFDSRNNEIHLKANFSIQKTREGAVKLFDSQYHTLKTLWKKHVIIIDPEIYHADRAFLFFYENHVMLALQRGKLYYLVDIDGIQIHEPLLRKGLASKVDYLVKHGLDNFTVESF